MNDPADGDDHARLMDDVYRWQRHIYDLTRKYYLFGRDRMIRELALAEGESVLEIGCGTGRNLALVRRAWPGSPLYGLDISDEMLKSARMTLGPAVVLAQGDATGFLPLQTFGRRHFDRILMPYCVSMIPDWQTAINHAATLLAPGGALHIVDFGDMGGLPSLARSGLTTWLAQFHVTPRADLVRQAVSIAGSKSLRARAVQGPGRYYQIVTIGN